MNKNALTIATLGPHAATEIGEDDRHEIGGDKDRGFHAAASCRLLIQLW